MVKSLLAIALLSVAPAFGMGSAPASNMVGCFSCTSTGITAHGFDVTGTGKDVNEDFAGDKAIIECTHQGGQSCAVTTCTRAQESEESCH